MVVVPHRVVVLASNTRCSDLAEPSTTHESRRAWSNFDASRPPIHPYPAHHSSECHAACLTASQKSQGVFARLSPYFETCFPKAYHRQIRTRYAPGPTTSTSSRRGEYTTRDQFQPNAYVRLHPLLGERRSKYEGFIHGQYEITLAPYH